MTLSQPDIARSKLLIGQDGGRRPNYDRNNPVMRLIGKIEGFPLAADRQHYLADSIQYLFPIASLAFYGPSGGGPETADPRGQDNREDFQKQNLREVTLTGVQVARGFAAIGEAWIGSFVSIAFSPSQASPLVGGDGVCRAPHLRLHLKIGDHETTSTIVMPFDEESQLYRVELWALDAGGMPEGLGSKAQNAWGSFLLSRPDLVKGTHNDLFGEPMHKARADADASGGAVELLNHAPGHTVHPIRTLRLELAFADPAQETWDSHGGRNHRLEFSMNQRGWNGFLSVGRSRNAHGGLGYLEYRNLYSNYFGHEQRRRDAAGSDLLPELGRDLPDWSFDAYGRRPAPDRRERFMAVDYMDLHILEPDAIIGIHRHRDNQEAFLLMEGKALMVMADWEQRDDRDRAFEIRTIRPGDLSIVKGGQMHALINSLDERALLFMFGGYD
jgi:mannose-6-phosphate isomerase-like protein (cupin superfamily)